MLDCSHARFSFTMMMRAHSWRDGWSAIPSKMRWGGGGGAHEVHCSASQSKYILYNVPYSHSAGLAVSNGASIITGTGRIPLHNWTIGALAPCAAITTSQTTDVYAYLIYTCGSISNTRTLRHTPTTQDQHVHPRAEAGPQQPNPSTNQHDEPFTANGQQAEPPKTAEANRA